LDSSVITVYVLYNSTFGKKCPDIAEQTGKKTDKKLVIYEDKVCCILHV